MLIEGVRLEDIELRMPTLRGALRIKNPCPFATEWLRPEALRRYPLADQAGGLIEEIVCLSIETAAS